LAVREADGVTMWTTRSSSLYRDVALEGDCPPGGDRAILPEDFTPQATVEIPLSGGLPHLYSECADIWNPIHTERRVAHAAGLPDIIVHGTALWALVGTLAGGEERRLARLACAFRAPALPATVAHLDYRIAETMAHWRLTSAKGETLVAGVAEFHTA
jgi:hypothetical protein